MLIISLIIFAIIAMIVAAVHRTSCVSVLRVAMTSKSSISTGL